MNGSFDLRLLVAIVTPIVTVAAAFLIAWIANFWRNKKKLSFRILSDAALDLPANLNDKLQIYFEAERIMQPRFITLAVINDGKTAIKETDFEKSLDFVFADDAVIRSAEIYRAFPENIKIAVRFEKNVLSLQPGLLNSRDYFQIQIILDGAGGLQRCDGRILDVNKVTDLEQPRLLPSASKFIVTGIITVLSFYIFVVQKDDVAVIGIFSGAYLFFDYLATTKRAYDNKKKDRRPF